MSNDRTYTVDLIAGDGIGQEVGPPPTRCVDRLGPGSASRSTGVTVNGARSTTSRTGG